MPGEHAGSCFNQYVSDLVNRTPRKELVVKDRKCYRVSPMGLGSFLLLSLETLRTPEEMDSTNNGDKVF